MSVLDKFLDAIKLNDDYDDEDDFFDDDDMDELEEDKPKKSFFSKFRSSKYDDDEDDYLDDEDDYEFAKPSKKTAATKAAPKTSTRSATKPQPKPAPSKITPLRKKSGSAGMEVCVIKPSNMEDAHEIADTLIDMNTVVLNLEGLNVETAQRIIDFASGSCYSIGGRLQVVSSYIFILTPSSVEISGDIQNILGGAFDVPSIRTGF